MIAKTFSGGRTYRGAVATVAYLLDERVEENTSRLLRGDSEITLSLIKGASKKQKWSWSSGVLSFSEMISDDVCKEIMDEFEQTFYAGFSKEQYDITWIKHTDKGRTELHYISPRLEVLTGKAFNPYFVKRDFRKKDIWQEVINQKYHLHSIADNPQLSSHLPDREWDRGVDLDLDMDAKWRDIKKNLDKQLGDMSREGRLQNRNDVMDILRSSGFELGDKVKPNAIVVLDTQGKPHILKGGLYSEDFNNGVGDLNKKLVEKNTPFVKINEKFERTRDLEKLTVALGEIVKKQAFGNQKKYGVPLLEAEVTVGNKIVLQPSLRAKKSKLINEEKKNERIRTTIARLDARDGERKREREERERARKKRVAYLSGSNQRATGRDFEGVEEAYTQRRNAKRGIEVVEGVADSLRKFYDNISGLIEKIGEVITQISIPAAPVQLKEEQREEKVLLSDENSCLKEEIEENIEIFEMWKREDKMYILSMEINHYLRDGEVEDFFTPEEQRMIKMFGDYFRLLGVEEIGEEGTEYIFGKESDELVEVLFETLKQDNSKQYRQEVGEAKMRNAETRAKNKQSDHQEPSYRR